MSRYEVFRDIDRSFRSFLEKNLQKVNGKHARVVVGPPRREVFGRGELPLVNLYLYNIQEDASRKDPNKVLVTERDARGLTTTFYVNPPVALELSYLLTTWGKDAEEEDALMGQVIRVIEDHRKLSGEDELAGDSFLPDETLSFELVGSMELDLQVRLWNSLGEPYRPSVTYLVRAQIDSERKSGPVTRVTRRITDFKEKRKSRSV